MVVDNWKRIIKFSYQFWGNILAAVFSACEFALPYINEVVYIPPKLFLILSFVVIILANMLRLVVQTNISARPGDKK
jgi:hypothetical protein